jgi:hypothetical protein
VGTGTDQPQYARRGMNDLRSLWEVTKMKKFCDAFSEVGAVLRS